MGIRRILGLLAKPAWAMRPISVEPSPEDLIPPPVYVTEQDVVSVVSRMFVERYKAPDARFLAVEHFGLNGQDFADWSNEKAAPFMTELLNRETYRFMQMAFGYLVSSGVEGDYHEFGCFSGRTFRLALSEARRYEMNDMRFYAYDSFEGLPVPSADAPPDVSSWSAGSMAMSDDEFRTLLDVHDVYRDKIDIVKGFFDQSLTPELQQQMLQSGHKIAFANVDCDLYESAIPVFDFIEPLLQEGSLVYIDDYYCGYRGNPTRGVAGAFYEYCKRSQWKFHPHVIAGWWGKAFIAYK